MASRVIMSVARYTRKKYTVLFCHFIVISAGLNHQRSAGECIYFIEMESKLVSFNFRYNVANSASYYTVLL